MRLMAIVCALLPGTAAFLGTNAALVAYADKNVPAGGPQQDGPNKFQLRVYPLPLLVPEPPLDEDQHRRAPTGLLLRLGVREVNLPVSRLARESEPGTMDRFLADFVAAIKGGDYKAVMTMSVLKRDIPEEGVRKWFKSDQEAFEGTDPVVVRVFDTGYYNALVLAGPESKEFMIVSFLMTDAGFKYTLEDAFDDKDSIVSELAAAMAERPEEFTAAQPPAGAAEIELGPVREGADARITVLLPGRDVSVPTPEGFHLDEGLPKEIAGPIRHYHRGVQALRAHNADAFKETLDPWSRENFDKLLRINKIPAVLMDAYSKQQEVFYVVPSESVTVLFTRNDPPPPLRLKSDPPGSRPEEARDRERARERFDVAYMDRTREGEYRRVNVGIKVTLDQLWELEEFRNEFLHRVVER